MCKKKTDFSELSREANSFNFQQQSSATQSYTDEIVYKSVFGLALMSSVLLILSMQNTRPNSSGFQITSFKFLFSTANFIAMRGRTRVLFLHKR